MPPGTRSQPQAEDPNPERPRAVTGLSAVCREIVYHHIFDNADREVGGVLVGTRPARKGPPKVTGAIEAFWADERATTLTFTQDAWEDVHSALEHDFPAGTEIIGWYHSHPGYGIFLSEHDLFIHQNFFGSPSQIALVVDPLNKTEGVFAWRAGQVQKLYERETPPDWAPSDVGDGPAIEPPEPEIPSPRVADSRNSPSSRFETADLVDYVREEGRRSQAVGRGDQLLGPLIAIGLIVLFVLLAIVVFGGGSGGGSDKPARSASERSTKP